MFHATSCRILTFVCAFLLRSYAPMRVHVLAVPRGQEMAVISWLKANPEVRLIRWW
jgi:hypothetical protein